MNESLPIAGPELVSQVLVWCLQYVILAWVGRFLGQVSSGPLSVPVPTHGTSETQGSPIGRNQVLLNKQSCFLFGVCLPEAFLSIRAPLFREKGVGVWSFGPLSSGPCLGGCCSGVLGSPRGTRCLPKSFCVFISVVLVSSAASLPLGWWGFFFGVFPLVSCVGGHF